ncbi:MAG: hypothetical protein ACI3V3_04175 [Faecousia sp.]
MEESWTRIPVPIPEERDRRELAAILTACGLEVRVVRLRLTQRGTPKRYLEFRDTGLAETKTVTE